MADVNKNRRLIASGAFLGGRAEDESYVFQTTKVGLLDFTLTLSSGTVNIFWGDGNTTFGQGSGTASNTYAAAGTKNIRIEGDVANITDINISNENIIAVDLATLTGITSLTLSDNQIVGVLDVSANTSLSVLGFKGNSSITNIDFGLVTSLTNIEAYQCDLTGTLDISAQNGLTHFSVYSNPNLTSITNPTANSATTVRYRAYSCGLTGTIDFSGYSAFAGELRLDNNSLTGFTQPTGGACNFFKVNDNSLAGTLDVSNLTLSGPFDVNVNNLTGITFAGSSGTLTSFSAKQNNLSTLNLSALTFGNNFGFSVWGNASLTSITFPTGAYTMSFLYCYNCNLSALDLSVMGNVTDLWAWNNNISTLTLTGQTGFNDLRVHGNSLASGFTLPNNNALELFTAENNGMSQAAVDSLIGSIYANRLNFTYASPTANLGGSNSAPTGTYQIPAACPATVPNEQVYEMVNDFCGDGHNLWTFTTS